MNDIGTRLKDERERLRLSQSAFAELAGARKGAQLKWEKGESSPNATALAAFAEAGADILYIITGQRQEQTPSPIDAAKAWGELHELERTLVTEGDKPLSETGSWEEFSGWSYKRVEGLRLKALIMPSQQAEDFEATLDDLLRKHLGDREAAKRREERFAAQAARRDEAEDDLEALQRALRLSITGELERELVALMVRHRIGANDMVPLLTALRSELADRD
jgi:transcriptional regulator with XRE-family HTH domain